MPTTTIRDVMTANPSTLPTDATVLDAATLMRDEGIGDVLVTDLDNRLVGVVTDRDIVVRVVADNADAAVTILGDVCSPSVVTVDPDASIAEAATLMRDNAVRRLPVVQDGRPLGIVSLGDLAQAGDEGATLGDISRAPDNNG